MVIEPFSTWPASNKPKPSPKPKPTVAQTKSWEKAYTAADAGSLGVTPKRSEPAPKPTPPSPPPGPSVTHYNLDQPHPNFPSRQIPAFVPDVAPLTDPAAASGFVAGTGMGSFLNESQARRDRDEADAAFSSATAFVSSFGPGNLVNESASHELTEQNADAAVEEARRQSPVFVYDPFAEDQDIFDTAFPTSEPTLTWQNDRNWLTDNTRGFDSSSLDADPRSNHINDPHGVIHVDGYGDLPIRIPSTEYYTGYLDGDVARVGSNAVLDRDDWNTIEIIGSTSHLVDTSEAQGAAALVGVLGSSIPYRSVRPEVYDGAYIDQRGNIYVSGDYASAPGGSQVPSDFTPPGDAHFNPVAGGAQALERATLGAANYTAVGDSGYALTQVYVQENSEGDRRAVIQRVQIGSINGGPTFAQSHYLTVDPSTGEFLGLDPVRYPDARVTWSSDQTAPEDNRIIESRHFSEAEILDPVVDSAETVPAVNEPPADSGHIPAPTGPGTSAVGGSVFDDNSNVNNAGIPVGR